MSKHRKIGCCYAAGVLVLAGLAVLLAPWGLILAWPALSLAVAAAAYLGLGPMVFGKRGGRVHPLMLALLGPYLVSLAAWHRQRHAAHPADPVTSRLLVGRRVSPSGADQLIEQGVTAVLDLTCEYSEAAPFLRLEYRNIQVLDLTPPSIDDLLGAARFVVDRMNDGMVYVHCAQGIGRSAIVAAACLLALDDQLDVDEACARTERARPGVRLRGSALRRHLEEYRSRWQAERSA